MAGWAGEDCDRCAAGFGGEDCTAQPAPQACPLGLHDHDADAGTPCVVCPASTFRGKASGANCEPCPGGQVSTPGSPSAAYCIPPHPDATDRTGKAEAAAAAPAAAGGGGRSAAKPTSRSGPSDRAATGGLFGLLDKNKNGLLHKLELRRGAGLLQSAGVEDDAVGLLAAADSDGNSMVSAEELWQYFEAQHRQPVPPLPPDEQTPADSLSVAVAEAESVAEWDAAGGYVWGPICQGRFGNQFDYLLGFLEYARQLNRTAVVGPFIEYNARAETGKYP